MIPKLPETIDADEMARLRELHQRIDHIREIPFGEVLSTNYLITPLRRTLQAMDRGASNFQLTPPSAPGRKPGNAPSVAANSSSDRPAQRTAGFHR